MSWRPGGSGEAERALRYWPAPSGHEEQVLVTALFNRAPHPNAAKVYINWLLSQEGQTLYARASGFVSARLDVPTDHTFPWRVPRPGAIKTYDKRSDDAKPAVHALLEEVFGKA